MRPIPQSLAKQPFGGVRVALCRQQEIDRRTRRIDCPIQITPPALDTNVSLVHTPRLIGGLKGSTSGERVFRSYLSPVQNFRVPDYRPADSTTGFHLSALRLRRSVVIFSAA